MPLRTALRMVRKHKGYTLISIAGLALGLASAFLILLFITFELSYDRFHPQAGRIYRVITEFQRDGRILVSADGLTALPFEETFPEVEAVAYLYTYSWKEKALVAHADKSFYEERFFLGDASVFKLFSLQVLGGDPGTALSGTDGVVISASAARRFFGEEDPLGKTLSVRNLGTADLKVTAVISDMPKNSHFRCDFIAPLAAGEKLFWKNFLKRTTLYTYLLLRPGASASGLEKKFPAFLASSSGEEWQGFGLHLQPLNSIHLRSRLSHEIEPNGDFKTVILLAVLALIILAVAAINFVNLTTALSINRVKEIGIKKTIGAKKSDIVRQFLLESVFLAFLALPVALVVARLLLPVFRSILDAELPLSFAGNSPLLGGALVLTFIVGLASGVYPALVVSGYEPTRALKGKSNPGGQGSLLRRSLVVFQYVSSVVLVIGALVVSAQMRYVRDKNLGFDREEIVIVPVKDYETELGYPALKTAFLAGPAVRGVTASRGIPSRLRSTHAVWHEGLQGVQDVELPALTVDFDFLSTFGIMVVQGRDFSRAFPSDERTAYLINESAARALGWTEPLGKRIQLSNRNLMRPSYVPGQVVGVVRDFHFRTLHEKILPLAIKLQKEGMTHIAVRIAPGKIRPALDFMAGEWKKIFPGRPFDFSFFDEDIARLYREDARTGRVFAWATAVSILIASLGLFGLASLSAAQRTKEVGIRKVLGASAERIVLLLSGEFGRLVLIANAVAWPLAYLIMSRWMQGFAYRTGIGIWVFLQAMGISFLMALLAVGLRAVRAALADPVECLRYE